MAAGIIAGIAIPAEQLQTLTKRGPRKRAFFVFAQTSFRGGGESGTAADVVA
jgi:hypothetical protein